MDVDPKHDQALDLPLSFPGDTDAPRSSSPSLTAAKLQQHQRAQSSLDAQRVSSRQAGPPTARRQSPRAPPPPPTYTVYIRVPAPRNGFVDPPDSNWSREKDDALWRILSRAPKNDIDWEELAARFETTVSHIIIQSTILTEQHLSQVRAQTRKVAVLGARDSPTQSPARRGEQSPSMNTAAQRLAGSPGIAGPAATSEPMGRTLSGGSRVVGGGRASAETMRRTASSGSKSSIDDGHARPPAPLRPSTVGVAAEPTRRLQSPLPIHAARRTGERGRGRARGPMARYGDGDGDECDDGDPESVAASSTTSPSSSSDDSEPVMSRIFRRPPGYPPQQPPPQQQEQQQTQSPRIQRLRQMQSQYSGSTTEAAYGGVGLGISSGGSDDGDESETPAAFLTIRAASHVASQPGPAASTHPSAPDASQRARRRTAPPKQPGRSSASSSASASPTTRVFKGPTLAASASASAAAAARLQQSRVPRVLSPPHVQPGGRGGASAASGAPPTRAGAALVSREGSEIGTTPSIGSSFSDLDDVSFTQSVLDEALGSKVEDTMVQHSSTDTLSSAPR